MERHEEQRIYTHGFLVVGPDGRWRWGHVGLTREAAWCSYLGVENPSLDEARGGGAKLHRVRLIFEGVNEGDLASRVAALEETVADLETELASRRYSGSSAPPAPIPPLC